MAGGTTSSDSVTHPHAVQAVGAGTQRGPDRFLLHVSDPPGPPAAEYRARVALGERGTLVAAPSSPGHFMLALKDGMTLGVAIAALVRAGVDVLACRELAA